MLFLRPKAEEPLRRRAPPAATTVPAKDPAPRLRASPARSSRRPSPTPMTPPTKDKLSAGEDPARHRRQHHTRPRQIVAPGRARSPPPVDHEVADHACPRACAARSGTARSSSSSSTTTAPPTTGRAPRALARRSLRRPGLRRRPLDQERRRYQAITRGADLEQSPTIVVADRNLKAETLVGFVDAETIQQTVVDALRAWRLQIRDPYFRQVDAICRPASSRSRRSASRLRRPPSPPISRPPRRSAPGSTQGRADQGAEGAPGLRHRVRSLQRVDHRPCCRRPRPHAKANPAQAKSSAHGHGQGQAPRQALRRQARPPRPELLLGRRPTLGA